jgi:ATP/ADP translocase
MSMRVSAVPLAMLSAAVLAAEFVGGKATRDALLLTALPVSALPGMLMATSLLAVLFAAGHARAMRGRRLGTFVPASFALSAAAFVLEWMMRSTAPSLTAVLVYVHVSATGPLVASGFWLVLSERFDPATAKRHFGRIAAAGTLGGLLGALAAERVAALLGAPVMLLVLAALQLAAAVLVWQLADDRHVMPAPTVLAGSSRMGAEMARIAAAPHLRRLMLLVVAGTTSAALLDFLFKTQAVELLGRGDALLRFFALYYAATSVVTFGLQVFGSRPVLERFGVGLTTSAPSIAVLAGGLVSLIVPGFGSLAVARAGESALRGSLLRAA